MKPLTILVLACAVAQGCTYSREPVGSDPAPIDPAAWEGTWVPAAAETRDAVRIEVLDAALGHLRLSVILDEGSDLETYVTDAYVRPFGHWTVVSIACPPEECEGAPRFDWGRIELDDDTGVLWWPDSDKVKALVDSGLLPGDADRFDVTLGPLAAEHIELFTSEAHGVLMVWDQPVFLRRVAR